MYMLYKVNVHVYSLDIPVSSLDRTPLVLEHTLSQSHLLGGESSFLPLAVAIANHYSLAVSYHQVRITAE